MCSSSMGRTLLNVAVGPSLSPFLANWQLTFSITHNPTFLLSSERGCRTNLCCHAQVHADVTRFLHIFKPFHHCINVWHEFKNRIITVSWIFFRYSKINIFNLLEITILKLIEEVWRCLKMFEEFGICNNETNVLINFVSF